MHEEILTNRQVELIPLIRLFNRSFYLVGGTAIALYLGHRHSIDFDLFNPKTLNRKNIYNKIIENNFHIDNTLVATNEEYTLITNRVKITFYNFPFDIPHKIKFKNIISMPTLLDLAAMKAYALGRRAKWKDYVDLYFILQYHYSLNELCKRAAELFGDLFSEKLFRAQLSFFADIDYSEPVSYVSDSIDENEIKEFLKEITTRPL
ncbi:MAG: nucleotidyl transferase AbiEii/AbiGii toxin family protein [Candidatus Zhuqueibacterota bacterium]